MNYTSVMAIAFPAHVSVSVRKEIPWYILIFS